jgi:hypothetical protein
VDLSSVIKTINLSTQSSHHRLKPNIHFSFIYTSKTPNTVNMKRGHITLPALQLAAATFFFSAVQAMPIEQSSEIAARNDELSLLSRTLNERQDPVAKPSAAKPPAPENISSPDILNNIQLPDMEFNGVGEGGKGKGGG